MAGSDKYVALLRGINVSGKNPIKMTDLKALLNKAGFVGVQTYLQSGNILFEDNRGLENREYSEKISDLIRDAFDFDIQVVTFSLTELRKMVGQNSFLVKEPDKKKLYYIFLGNEPKQFSEKDLIGEAGESFDLSAQCIYAYYPNGYGRSKRNNNFFERKLGTWATTRNQNTVEKLLALMEGQT